MLCLSRRIGEKILIGNDIEVVVVDISRGRVRLGIEAPHTVRIDRPEVREAREQEWQAWHAAQAEGEQD